MAQAIGNGVDACLRKSDDVGKRVLACEGDLEGVACIRELLEGVDPRWAKGEIGVKPEFGRVSGYVEGSF